MCNYYALSPFGILGRLWLLFPVSKERGHRLGGALRLWSLPQAGLDTDNKVIVA